MLVCSQQNNDRRVGLCALTSGVGLSVSIGAGVMGCDRRAKRYWLARSRHINHRHSVSSQSILTSGVGLSVGAGEGSEVGFKVGCIRVMM